MKSTPSACGFQEHCNIGHRWVVLFKILIVKIRNNNNMEKTITTTITTLIALTGTGRGGGGGMGRVGAAMISAFRSRSCKDTWSLSFHSQYIRASEQRSDVLIKGHDKVSIRCDFQLNVPSKLSKNEPLVSPSQMKSSKKQSSNIHLGVFDWPHDPHLLGPPLPLFSRSPSLLLLSRHSFLLLVHCFLSVLEIGRALLDLRHDANLQINNKQ